MNEGKPLTKDCKICHSTDLSYFRYGNHLNHFNVRFFKHYLANFLYQIIHPIYINTKIEAKILFSPIFKIIRCNNCGYGFYDREISIQILKKYYRNIYWQACGLDKSKQYDDNLFLQDNRANGQYNFVKKELDNLKKINILEIGAGSSLTSRMIKYKNKDKTVTIDVVEPGVGWTDYYNSHDINKVADFFPFPSRVKYNYIHATHYLEHTLDLKNTTRKINELLISGGYFFVEVPNCTSDYFKLDYGDTPHIHFFTETSLVTFLKNNGFKKIRSETYGFTSKEFYIYRNKKCELSDPIYEKAMNSIKYSVSRKNGLSLRALFRKI